MIREIIKDQFILSQKSKPATQEDILIIEDLIDTIKAHEDHCVGIAANMIGQLKRIMVVNNQGTYLTLINPIVLKYSGRYTTVQEGCLCHEGTKSVKRYEKIKLEYYDQSMKRKIKTFAGFTAQIIQHELDHFEGKLI